MASSAPLLALAFVVATGCHGPKTTQPTSAPTTEPTASDPSSEAEPIASVEPEPEPEPEPKPKPKSGPLVLDSPPPGLDLEVIATPTRVRGQWIVNLELRARATGETAFVIGSTPAPHLRGLRSDRGGSLSTFADGCRTELGPDSKLKPGNDRLFSRTYGTEPGEALEPGVSVELYVGLCQVGMPKGGWPTVRAAKVFIEVPKSKGTPKVVVTPAVSVPGQ